MFPIWFSATVFAHGLDWRLVSASMFSHQNGDKKWSGYPHHFPVTLTLEYPLEKVTSNGDRQLPIVSFVHSFCLLTGNDPKFQQ